MGRIDELMDKDEDGDGYKSCSQSSIKSDHDDS